MQAKATLHHILQTSPEQYQQCGRRDHYPATTRESTRSATMFQCGNFQICKHMNGFI